MFQIIRIVYFFCIFSISFPQGYMNGLGLGYLNDNNGSLNTTNGSSKLIPNFQKGISLSNPSTWYNLKYTQLSLGYSSYSASIDGQSLFNGYSNISNAIWIIPIKSKAALGLCIEPYTEQRLSIQDNDTSYVDAFDRTIKTVKSIEQYGGLLKLRLGTSYAVKNNLGFGLAIDLLFGSSRKSESMFFDASSVVQSYQNRYSGLLGELFFNYKISDYIFIFSSLSKAINPVDVLITDRFIFDDVNLNGYHDPFDFPSIDSVDANPEIRLKDIHSPLSYSFGLQTIIKENKSIGIEYFGYLDEAGKVGIIEAGLNDYILNSNHIDLSFTRFPKDLSTQIFDKFIFRTGAIFKDYSLSNNANNIREFGCRLGLGFKFKNVGNQIDLNLYLGNRNHFNNYDNEFIKQLQVSISLADRWFVKRRQK